MHDVLGFRKLRTTDQTPTGAAKIVLVEPPVRSQAAWDAIRWEEEHGGNHCNERQHEEERWSQERWEDEHGA